jgi:hypothetical protein
MINKDGSVKAVRKSQNIFSANFSFIVYIKRREANILRPRNATAK